MQISIVDLGSGNLRSVEQAVKHVAVDHTVNVTSNPEEILKADKVIIPGQGAIGTWVKSYQSLDLDEAVRNALTNKPCFGICVGMQVMFDHSSEDGGVEGLKLFSGEVEHFKKFHSVNLSAEERMQSAPKIPHMGWNIVEQVQSHPLWEGIDREAYFYYVHSFSATSTDSSIVQGVTNYHHQFIAAAGRDNIFATQFHPEKSQTNGLKLLSNFVAWDGTV